jgi:hypothetical protein
MVALSKEYISELICSANKLVNISLDFIRLRINRDPKWAKEFKYWGCPEDYDEIYVDTEDDSVNLVYRDSELYYDNPKSYILKITSDMLEDPYTYIDNKIQERKIKEKIERSKKRVTNKAKRDKQKLRDQKELEKLAKKLGVKIVKD